MGSSNPQSRKWLLTINNPDDYELDHNSVKNTLHLFSPDYFALWMKLQPQEQSICTFSFTQNRRFAFQH